LSSSVIKRRRRAAMPLSTSTIFTERPSRLSQHMRRQAVAHLLAHGVLRLRQRASAASYETLKNSPVPGLELSAETVLSVSPGVNGPESSQRPRSAAC
jgi:hypothetical protein